MQHGFNFVLQYNQNFQSPALLIMFLNYIPLLNHKMHERFLVDKSNGFTTTFNFLFILTILFFNSFNLSSLRAAKIKFFPRFAKAKAVSYPIHELAPVNIVYFILTPPSQ